MKRIPRHTLPDLFRSPYFMLITYKAGRATREEITTPTKFTAYETMKRMATLTLRRDRESAIPVIAYIDLCAYDKHGPYSKETLK